VFTGLESPTKLLMLFGLLVLLFGAKRLPEIGRSLGSGIREFKHSVSGLSFDHEDASGQRALPAAEERDADTI
jgi:sec-independent protein translocase protein TatA